MNSLDDHGKLMKDAPRVNPQHPIAEPRQAGIPARLRDTLKRILDGEKDLNVLLPENYKPDVEPPAATGVEAAA